MVSATTRLNRVSGEAPTMRLTPARLAATKRRPAHCAKRSPIASSFRSSRDIVRVKRPRELDSSIQHRPAWNGRDAVKCLAFQRVRVP